MRASSATGWKPDNCYLELLQPLLHYGGHLLVPFALGWLLWRDTWLRAGAVIAAGNLIDLDHLLANPMFDPERCSIGFHLLHSWPVTIVYCMMLTMPHWWVRALALGALWHLAVDYGDCQWMGI